MACKYPLVVIQKSLSHLPEIFIEKSYNLILFDGFVSGLFIEGSLFIGIGSFGDIKFTLKRIGLKRKYGVDDTCLCMRLTSV